jgi:glycine/D-amino acid oxidase-like deaminating enzyme
VVIGAGLAGLATVQALCGLFDEVTLLERDDVAAVPASAEDASKDQVGVWSNVPERNNGHS